MARDHFLVPVIVCGRGPRCKFLNKVLDDGYCFVAAATVLIFVLHI